LNATKIYFVSRKNIFLSIELKTDALQILLQKHPFLFGIDFLSR